MGKDILFLVPQHPGHGIGYGMFNVAGDVIGHGDGYLYGYGDRYGGDMASKLGRTFRTGNGYGYGYPEGDGKGNGWIRWDALI